MGDTHVCCQIKKIIQQEIKQKNSCLKNLLVVFVIFCLSLQVNILTKAFIYNYSFFKNELNQHKLS